MSTAIEPRPSATVLRRCVACDSRGHAWRWETDSTGNIYRVYGTLCPTCRGAGWVSATPDAPPETP